MVKDRQTTETLIQDRLLFRRLLDKYHLLDLIGDENESIEWFRQIMLELAGWVGDSQRTREILRRFREEYERQKEEMERFERAAEAGFHNPYYSGKRFRKFQL